MSKKQCPDCDGVDFSSVLPRGDGKCEYCHGKGWTHEIHDALTEIMTFDSVKSDSTCEDCSKTGQCQTCGGEGYVYEANYSDSSDKEVEYNGSGGGNSYSSNLSDYSGSGESYTTQAADHGQSSYRGQLSPEEGQAAKKIGQRIFLIAVSIVLLGIIFLFSGPNMPGEGKELTNLQVVGCLIVGPTLIGGMIWVFLGGFDS